MPTNRAAWITEKCGNPFRVADAPMPPEEGSYALAGEPVQAAMRRMLELNLESLPVVDHLGGAVVGRIGLADLVQARSRSLEEERLRERVLGRRSRKEVLNLLPVNLDQ